MSITPMLRWVAVAATTIVVAAGSPGGGVSAEGTAPSPAAADELTRLRRGHGGA